MFERYTEEARRALFFARAEASELGHVLIEAEHLLLGIAHDDRSVAGRILSNAHLSLEEIRRRVARGRESVSTSVEMPFTSDAKRALEHATEESQRLLHTYIGPEHLLLGLLREEHGRAASILHESGLRLAPVRDQIVVMLGATAPPSGVPIPRMFGGAFHRVHVSPSLREPHEGPIASSSPHRVTAKGFTLKALIAWAYRADEHDIEMAAEFDEDKRYDIRLDVPGAEGWPTLDRLVQEGVATHFGLTITRETTSRSVIVLSIEEGRGLQLRQDDDTGVSAAFAAFSTISETTDPSQRLHSIGPITMHSTIADFCRALGDFLGAPVIDETGLRGTYDINLQGEMHGLEDVARAVRAQLGLVLTETARDAPVLMVRPAG